MSEILSQDEIDALMTAIFNGEIDLNKYTDISPAKALDEIESFENYLIERQPIREKPYGIFDEDIYICEFFDSNGNEKILEDIKRKNEEQGYGNIKIPNTDITLINYSFCPRCRTIYSFKDVLNYYIKPKPDMRFKSSELQYREDTRVYCGHCDTYFLPSLIISDGTPKNEVQFLCRAQTIDAVENFFLRKRKNVLTRNRKNIIQRGNLKAIKNDVYLKDLVEKQTLITNIIQYTPLNIMMNLIDGTNVKKGDLLFNEWNNMEQKMDFR